MARYGYTKNLVMLGPTSIQSSTYTSNPFLIADATTISLSYLTNLTSVATITVRVSNDDGLTAGSGAITWSTMSLIGSQGVFQVTPGPRWISVVRNAIDSQASVILNFRVT
jgi:hypothetical protein